MKALGGAFEPEEGKTAGDGPKNGGDGSQSGAGYGERGGRQNAEAGEARGESGEQKVNAAAAIMERHERIAARLRSSKK